MCRDVEEVERDCAVGCGPGVNLIAMSRDEEYLVRRKCGRRSEEESRLGKITRRIVISLCPKQTIRCVDGLVFFPRLSRGFSQSIKKSSLSNRGRGRFGVFPRDDPTHEPRRLAELWAILNLSCYLAHQNRRNNVKYRADVHYD